MGVRLEPMEVRLGPGDRLLAYTDGLVEQENEGGEPFGSERAGEVLRSRELPLSEALRALERELDAFSGGVEPMDDVTVIAVELLR